MKNQDYSHLDTDAIKRRDNIASYGALNLCERCDGSGNQLYSMYQQCEACAGTGIKGGTRAIERLEIELPEAPCR